MAQLLRLLDPHAPVERARSETAYRRHRFTARSPRRAPAIAADLRELEPS